MPTKKVFQFYVTDLEFEFVNEGYMSWLRERSLNSKNRSVSQFLLESVLTSEFVAPVVAGKKLKNGVGKSVNKNSRLKA